MIAARRLVVPEGPPSAMRVLMPRCTAQREGPYANDTPATDKQCSLTGRYLVDGRPLCTKHAGVFALRYLIAQTPPEPIAHHNV